MKNILIGEDKTGELKINEHKRKFQNTKFSKKKIYEIDDFTKFYNEDFIFKAFEGILKREPIQEEKDFYLPYLKSGKKSKTEIILLIRFSEEGKEKDVKILGIKKRYFVLQLFKLPIIGYLIQILYMIFSLPKFIQRINHFENSVWASKIDNQKLSEVDNRLAHKIKTELNDRLNQKIDEKIIIPNSLEVKANDFLGEAIKNFSYPISKFNEFNKDELYYSLFETVFYQHKVIIEKQKIYLKFIPKINSIKNPHLDIGCGRGEFITILKNSKYEVVGVDINSLEVNELKKKGFNVYHKDMIDFLQNHFGTFSSISALQVIEHIDYDILRKFLTLAYEKIEDGGVLIVETINPHNKIALNNFYMDETHKRPLPPEMIAFLLQWIGFKNIKFQFTSPMPEEFRSKNDYRINYHDYAVIGYKLV